MKKNFGAVVFLISLCFTVIPLYAQDYWDLYNFGQNLFYDALIDANKIKYVIVNSTGKSIQEIYISVSTQDNWGKNQWQSQELLPTGYQIEAKSDDVGPYDIRLVDIDENEYIKSRVRITSDLIVTFTENDKVKKSISDRLKGAWNSLFGN
ncbi:hypothetical protein FACS1894142_6990 [Spirochaetia bacterium]|nr:hypothetical protein FACS1894142_6990 [Spirochaetia bacterium]